MSMVIHNFKKDIRHLKWILGVWFILTGLYAAAGMIALDTVQLNPFVFNSFQMVSVIVPSLMWLSVIVILPLLVQDDATAGSDAFWMSRPIRGREFFASKSIFILSLLLLPLVLGEAIYMFLNNASFGQVALMAPQQLLGWSTIIVAAWFFASITRTFGRYIVVVLLSAITLFGGIMLYYFSLSYFAPEKLMGSFLPDRLAASRSLVAGLILLIGGGFVVYLQFVSRRTLRTVSVAALVVALYLAAGAWWPIEVFESKITNEDDIPEDSVTLSIGGDLNTYEQSWSGTGAPSQTMSGRIILVSPVPRVELTAELSDQKIVMGNGEEIKSMGGPGSFSFGNSPANSQALEETLDGNVERSRSMQMDQIFLFNSEDYHRLAGQSATLIGMALVKAYRYEPAGSMLPKKGERIRNGVRQTLISDVTKAGSTLLLTLRERYSTLMFEHRNERSIPFFNRPWAAYVIRDSSTNRIIIPDDPHPDGSYNSAQYHTISYAPLSLKFTLPPGTDYDNLEFIRVDSVLVDEFEIPFTTKIRIPPADGNTSPFRLNSEFSQSELDGFVLPDNPAETDVKKFLSTFQFPLAGGNFSSDDPAVEQIRSLSKTHMDVLLDYYGDVPYVAWGLKDRITEDHREAVLNRLAAQPNLAEVVLQMGWQEEAKDTIVALLQSPPLNLPTSATLVGATYKDPDLYDELLYQLRSSHNRARIYDAIKDLPDLSEIKLDEAVKAAWANAQSLESEFMTLQFAPIAAKHGIRGALEESITQGLNSEHFYLQKITRDGLKDILTFQGSDRDLIEWYEANSDRLIFNPRTQTWVVKD